MHNFHEKQQQTIVYSAKRRLDYLEANIDTTYPQAQAAYKEVARLNTLSAIFKALYTSSPKMLEARVSMISDYITKLVSKSDVWTVEHCIEFITDLICQDKLYFDSLDVANIFTFTRGDVEDWVAAKVKYILKIVAMLDQSMLGGPFTFPTEPMSMLPPIPPNVGPMGNGIRSNYPGVEDPSGRTSGGYPFPYGPSIPTGPLGGFGPRGYSSYIGDPGSSVETMFSNGPLSPCGVPGYKEYVHPNNPFTPTLTIPTELGISFMVTLPSSIFDPLDIVINTFLAHGRPAAAEPYIIDPVVWLHAYPFPKMKYQSFDI